MKRNRILLVALGIIFALIGYYSEGWTEENTNGWVLYTTSEKGNYYYNKNDTSIVGTNIFNVWSKVEYKQIGDDEENEIRKEYGLPIIGKDGLDKVDYRISNFDLDCEKSTEKEIKYIDYSYDGKKIHDSQIPDPKMKKIIPGSIMEILRNTVCSQK